jgi:hypothetical protein
VTLPDALSGDVRPIPAADEGSIERKMQVILQKIRMAPRAFLWGVFDNVFPIEF